MEQHQHLQLHRHPEGVHHCSSALLVHDLQVCRRVDRDEDEGWSRRARGAARSASWVRSIGPLARGVVSLLLSRPWSGFRFSWVFLKMCTLFVCGLRCPALVFILFD